MATSLQVALKARPPASALLLVSVAPRTFDTHIAPRRPASRDVPEFQDKSALDRLISVMEQFGRHNPAALRDLAQSGAFRDSTMQDLLDRVAAARRGLGHAAGAADRSGLFNTDAKAQLADVLAGLPSSRRRRRSDIADPMLMQSDGLKLDPTLEAAMRARGIDPNAPPPPDSSVSGGGDDGGDDGEGDDGGLLDNIPGFGDPSEGDEDDDSGGWLLGDLWDELMRYQAERERRRSRGEPEGTPLGEALDNANEILRERARKQAQEDDEATAQNKTAVDVWNNEIADALRAFVQRLKKAFTSEDDWYRALVPAPPAQPATTEEQQAKEKAQQEAKKKAEEEAKKKAEAEKPKPEQSDEYPNPEDAGDVDVPWETLGRRPRPTVKVGGGRGNAGPGIPGNIDYGPEHFEPSHSPYVFGGPKGRPGFTDPLQEQVHVDLSVSKPFVGYVDPHPDPDV
jgi:hypothetical protein